MHFLFGYVGLAIYSAFDHRNELFWDYAEYEKTPTGKLLLVTDLYLLVSCALVASLYAAEYEQPTRSVATGGKIKLPFV